MSMIFCQGCDSDIDTDFHECHEFKGDLICDHCYQNLDFMTNEAIVDFLLENDKSLALTNYYQI